MFLVRSDGSFQSFMYYLSLNWFDWLSFLMYSCSFRGIIPLLSALPLVDKGASGANMIQEPVPYNELLQVVSKWSPALKFTLIRDLLQSLEPTVATLQPPQPSEPQSTLEQALGLLATNAPAPSDDEVQQILVESRAEKYG